MEKFARAFVLNIDGSWFCSEPACFVGMRGLVTITPGLTYRRGESWNGYDIARWLDDWHDAGMEPANVAFI